MQVQHGQAHVMTHTLTTTNWLFDSGASFHATNELNNLSVHTLYDGTKELVTDDGLCFKISHIGSIVIHTLNTPHSSLTEYRNFIGDLQYLSLTRPDISFKVSRLSQFSHAPTFQHWMALKRLLRYLHGTLITT